MLCGRLLVTHVEWQERCRSRPSVQHPDALYSIYRCYKCGYRYPGAGADRPPRAPSSKHPGVAKRSLIAATPGSSPLFMRLGLWSGWAGKTRETETAEKSGAKRNPNRMRKRERERRSADGPDHEKHNVPIADRGILRRYHTKPPSYPCCRRATQAGGGDDLCSHTSPQSSWSDCTYCIALLISQLLSSSVSIQLP